MLALVNTPNGAAPVELREVAEPEPAPNEAVVEVRAFSLNRGELRLFQVRPEGWRPGQDISGVVMQPAADGSGPKAGDARRRTDRQRRLGRARRCAEPPHGGAAGQRPFRGGRGVAGRRLDRAAHLAARRAAARQAGADHRRRRRRRAHGHPDRRTIRGACYRGRRQPRARPASARRRRDHRRHRQGARPVRLILEAAGGASLAAAIARIEAKGTIVVFGNSSGEPTPISFRDFAERPNARIQSFSYFTSEAEERFAPDLALLVSLVADGSLKPHLVEQSWRDLAPIGPQLRDRHIAGKAVFRID